MTHSRNPRPSTLILLFSVFALFTLTSAVATASGPGAPGGSAWLFPEDSAAVEPAASSPKTGGNDQQRGPEEASRTESAGGGDRVEWNDQWGRPKWWEAALAFALLLGPSRIFNRIATSGIEPWWTDVNGFDQALTDAIGAETKQGMRTAEVISDIPFQTLLYYPIVIDSVFVAWFVHDDAEVAINTAIISLLSIAIVGSTTRGLHLLTRRERPKFPDDICSDEPDAEYPCDREALAMPGGHVAIAFNGAGLICATHEKIPLYGGMWDSFACGAALVAATIPAVARVVNRDHHATDNIAGAALGLTTGYLIPKLLHYGFGDDETTETARLPRPVPTSVLEGELDVQSDHPGSNLELEPGFHLGR